MDFVFAYSLFTHLSLNAVEEALARVAEVLKPCGKFFATAFLCAGDACRGAVAQPFGIFSFPDADPYHYSEAQLSAAADRAGFAAEVLPNAEWPEPREQSMIRFVGRNDLVC